MDLWKGIVSKDGQHRGRGKSIKSLSTLLIMSQVLCPSRPVAFSLFFFSFHNMLRALLLCPDLKEMSLKRSYKKVNTPCQVSIQPLVDILFNK